MGLAIDQRPGPVRFTYAFLRLARGLKCDVEAAAITLADPPFAEEMTASRQAGGQSGFTELDMLDVGDFFPVAVFVNDRGGVLRSMRAISAVASLVMPVFVDDHDGP